MHIFLTGGIQVGKSTLVQRIVSGAPLPIGGFETYFHNRASDDRVLVMQQAGIPHAGADTAVVARFECGRPQVNPAMFDEVGTRLLRQARASASLIVMDECGKLERDAHIFQAEVLKTLDGETPVLGVVRMDAGGWTEKITRHPNVRVIVVTEENRDELARRPWPWTI